MNNTKTMNNVQILTRSAVLVALSAVGAMIKIQGSIALDSMPGFFAALYINPMAGAVVAALGHLLTAFSSGFPLSLPMHLMLMFVMGAIAYIFGKIATKNGILACMVAIILNGPVATYISAEFAKILGLGFSGIAMFTALVIPLTLAGAVNIIGAYILNKLISKNKVM